jgi:uncharacterized protein (DUF2141 family)
MKHARIVLAYSAIALVLFGAAAGCSSGTSVDGTVNLDGSPVDGGTIIMFQSADNQRKNVVSGPITGGKYSLKSRELVPGTYQVEIVWNKKTGKKIMSSDPPNMIDETKQVIPKSWNVESKQTIQVKSGANTHNFEPKSK